MATLISPFFGDALMTLNPILTFGVGGRFQYTVSTQNPPNIIGGGLSTTENIFTLGTFHDTTGTFSDAAASLVFAFTESCSGPLTGCTESGSASFATPPASQSPEPAPLFLTGGALLGVGLLRRRYLLA
jgi:hypothetical protein